MVAGTAISPVEAGDGHGTATADHRCVKTNDLAVAAGDSVDPARWQEAFEGLMRRIAGRFARVEPRRRVRQLVLGLLSDLPQKNCWTIAEWAGDTTPDGMQHLLGRAKWDADAVRGDVRGYVVEHLHDDRAVLVDDETGDVKKGTHTVGVQRQYTGTAGARIPIGARQRGGGGSLRYGPVCVRPRCCSCSAGQVRSDPAALR